MTMCCVWIGVFTFCWRESAGLMYPLADIRTETSADVVSDELLYDMRIKKTLVEANCAQGNRFRGTPHAQLLRYAEQDASDWICPVAVIIETAAGAIAC